MRPPNSSKVGLSAALAGVGTIFRLIAHPVGEPGEGPGEILAYSGIGDGFVQCAAHAQEPGVALGFADLVEFRLPRYEDIRTTRQSVEMGRLRAAIL